MLVEVLFDDVFNWQIFINSGILDQDVEPAEYVLGLCKKLFNLCIFGNICLECDRLPTNSGNFINHAICASQQRFAIGSFFARCVVDDYSGTLGSFVTS